MIGSAPTTILFDMIPILANHEINEPLIGRIEASDQVGLTVKLRHDHYISTNDIREVFGNIGFRPIKMIYVEDIPCFNEFAILEWSLNPAMLLRRGE